MLNDSEWFQIVLLAAAAAMSLVATVCALTMVVS
jgi:hypothetical protein